MILNSLLPRKEMLTPCFKGLILLNHRKCLLAVCELWQWRNPSSSPSHPHIKGPFNPHLKSATHFHVLLPSSLSWSPLWSPCFFHTRITMWADHCGWKLRRAGPKRNWAAAQTTPFGIRSESLGDLSSSSSLVLIVCIASSAHESIWRLIPTLQRKAR